MPKIVSFLSQKYLKWLTDSLWTPFTFLLCSPFIYYNIANMGVFGKSMSNTNVVSWSRNKMHGHMSNMLWKNDFFWLPRYMSSHRKISHFQLHLLKNSIWKIVCMDDCPHWRLSPLKIVLYHIYPETWLYLPYKCKLSQLGGPLFNGFIFLHSVPEAFFNCSFGYYKRIFQFC